MKKVNRPPRQAFRSVSWYQPASEYFYAPDASRARIYSGPTLYTDNAGQTPVTADFEDVDHDGKIDMIVHIGNQNIVYINDGTQFKPQQ